MIRLDQRSRTLALCASALCFAGAFTVTPGSARSADDPIRTENTHVRTAPSDAPLTMVRPRRDPFVGEELARDASLGPAPPLPPIPMGTMPVVSPLPPNAGAGLGVEQLGHFTSRAVHLKAIVNGTRPVALIAEGLTTRVVSLGDIVEGTAIRGIARDRVTLADGTHLTLESESQTQATDGRFASPIPAVPSALPTGSAQR